jgi:1,4-alpha-glucan branching enzyme
MAKKSATQVAPARTQVFAFSAPMALHVQWVGDFTRWTQQPINLKKDADGVWRTEIALAPGAHHYRIIVDGQWSDDPECALRVPNPYGGENMVRKVD